MSPLGRSSRSARFSGETGLRHIESELIWERTRAGLEAARARARGRTGGRTFSLNKPQVWLAQASIVKTETNVGELWVELDISRVTLYRYAVPNGKLREYGRRVLNS